MMLSRYLKARNGLATYLIPKCRCTACKTLDTFYGKYQIFIPFFSWAIAYLSTVCWLSSPSAADHARCGGKHSRLGDIRMSMRDQSMRSEINFCMRLALRKFSTTKYFTQNIFDTKISRSIVHVCTLYVYMYGTGGCAYLNMRHTIILDASLKCFVCGANTLATFKPCGHCVLCEACAARIKRCPTCKVFTLCNVS